jgi:hypothetical protein
LASNRANGTGETDQASTNVSVPAQAIPLPD